ncbi:aldo/keto reductase [Pedobacter caeni]|uniref:D-threo-aldose 1-dehydrogenase n=1 Tax=Pedobacter caeni TaxID=288992 RepID=A0A1M5A1I5_9SPHI|nr:aldo/keto reductase [Pedobacter caeni]SHF24095.1 D-threo-aldose 1-dehydrogenase [Pedobacter caeni]
MNGLNLPPVIFGTSSLGNLYHALDYTDKLNIVRSCMLSGTDIPVFDTAGKYGAGLALETLGKCLQDLNISPGQVVICNKLGWYRTPLLSPEPTFEPGIWKGLYHDAVQMIGYEGILKCFEQGNGLLGNYTAQMVSVHDPDEYLSESMDDDDYRKRYGHIIDAYTALAELKSSGRVSSIGIGAKDWKVIRRIAADVDLDWVMIANSLTLKSHPEELIAFVKELHQKEIKVINSGVFNGGFLTGGNFYNYLPVDGETVSGKALLDWRATFFGLCNQFGILPAEACFNFSFRFPGIGSIALNTTKPEKIAGNVALTQKNIPVEFWKEMAEQGLIKTLNQHI